MKGGGETLARIKDGAGKDRKRQHREVGGTLAHQGHGRTGQDREGQAGARPDAIATKPGDLLISRPASHFADVWEKQKPKL